MALSHQPSPFDIFQWLPKEVQTAFTRAARQRHCAQGELIYGQGERGEQMFRLLSGSVRLSVARSDGRELLYLLFEPGDCFGTSSLIDGDRRPQTAEAGSELEIQVLGKPAFDRLRSEHRAFDDALLRLMSRHMRLLSGFFADAHLDDITARVASRIVATALSFGTPSDGGIALSVALSQAELALMVGGSRQTVNKVLQQFQKEGLVTVKGGRLVIRSIAGLRNRADAPPHNLR
jgi:CRP/FNR family cyclic AMP-dependent transcriptional regulator